MADTWRVVSQRQSSDISPGGQFQEVMEVVVETVTGTSLTVRVPLSQYNAETVQAMIERRVTDALAVEEL